jgi:hypothetical protein
MIFISGADISVRTLAYTQTPVRWPYRNGAALVAASSPIASF